LPPRLEPRPSVRARKDHNASLKAAPEANGRLDVLQSIVNQLLGENLGRPDNERTSPRHPPL
jgi:hypothetical protein